VLADATDATARIGENISYKGVPYYQAQLNEFVRTYAQSFNDIQTAGEDLYGNKGTDFFNAADNITGSDYVFGQSDSQKTAGIVISSNTGSYLNTDDTNYGSYYLMTAANFKVTDSVLNDPSRVAAASSITDGVENADQAKKMAELENKDIFLQGTPSEYLNSIVAEIGIDSEKAQTFSENQNNICKTIENQRLSVSGVDSEEEAMSLIEYQNAYNLSAKAISVMNEIYDKLINYMGA
jgi:flagellar hook-associated protein 1 FlgK